MTFRCRRCKSVLLQLVRETHSKFLQMHILAKPFVFVQSSRAVGVESKFERDAVWALCIMGGNYLLFDFLFPSLCLQERFSPTVDAPISRNSFNACL